MLSRPNRRSSWALRDLFSSITVRCFRALSIASSSSSRSEEHMSELQSPCNLVCRLLLEKKKKTHCLYCLTPNHTRHFSDIDMQPSVTDSSDVYVTHTYQRHHISPRIAANLDVPSTLSITPGTYSTAQRSDCITWERWPG